MHNLGDTGLSSGNDAIIHISNSTVWSNKTGLFTFADGQIVSFGNNKIVGNSTDGDPTSTVMLR